MTPGREDPLSFDELVREFAGDRCHVCSDTRHDAHKLERYRSRWDGEEVWLMHANCAPTGWTVDE